VRLDEHLAGVELCAHGAQGVPVCPRVIGHQAFDPGDAVGAEITDGPGQKVCTGRTFLVGQDLGVRQPGMVIDQGMNVVVSDLGQGRPSDALATVDTPAATVGDPADLLDIHMDQLARTAAFITHRCGL
jgi:hypothetical protein